LKYMENQMFLLQIRHTGFMNFPFIETTTKAR